jgi:hypothetical protein
MGRREDDQERSVRHERLGFRDMLYSMYHRTLAEELHYIDIDAVEYCAECRTPIALIETVRDVGQNLLTKSYTVTRRLALMAGLPAFVVAYRAGLDEDTNDEYIETLRVRQVSPSVDKYFTVMAPEEYEQWLLSLRKTHSCTK